MSDFDDDFKGDQSLISEPGEEELDEADSEEEAEEDPIEGDYI